MSIIQPVSVQQHPVVLRFAEMFPAQLGGYAMHGDRTGGDLSHVDADRSARNRILIGPADWREQALVEIDAMRHENLAEELEALKARGRTKEMDARMREGLKDPWRASRGGPLREVVLTASKDWFEAPDAPSMFGQPVAERELEFQAKAVEWLKRNFGDDVIHARADHDERTCHIHAIILPREVKKSQRRGTQRMLQPSVHPLIADYETAQDDVGAFFASVGLRRGDRSAEARRHAREAGLPLPDRREHIPPSRWREEEALRLRKEAERSEAERRLLAADAERIERQRAELEQGRASLVSAQRSAAAREAAALEREREADAIMAVVEAIEAGVISFDDEGGPVVATAGSPSAETLLDRVERGGVRGKSFLDRTGGAYRRLFARAAAAAEGRLREEFEVAGKAIAAANQFLRKAAQVLPEQFRARFRQDMSAEDARLLDAREDLARRREKLGRRENADGFE